MRTLHEHSGDAQSRVDLLVRCRARSGQPPEAGPGLQPGQRHGASQGHRAQPWKSQGVSAARSRCGEGRRGQSKISGKDGVGRVGEHPTSLGPLIGQWLTSARQRVEACLGAPPVRMTGEATAPTTRENAP